MRRVFPVEGGDMKYTYCQFGAMRLAPLHHETTVSSSPRNDNRRLVKPEVKEILNYATALRSGWAPAA